MAIGVGFEVSHKTSVILQVLEQQFLSSEEWVSCVDNNTNIAVFNIGL